MLKKLGGAREAIAEPEGDKYSACGCPSEAAVMGPSSRSRGLGSERIHFPGSDDRPGRNLWDPDLPGCQLDLAGIESS